jgi:hypothetical protein
MDMVGTSNEVSALRQIRDRILAIRVEAVPLFVRVSCQVFVRASVRGKQLLDKERERERGDKPQMEARRPIPRMAPNKKTAAAMKVRTCFGVKLRRMKPSRGALAALREANSGSFMDATTVRVSCDPARSGRLTGEHGVTYSYER